MDITSDSWYSAVNYQDSSMSNRTPNKVPQPSVALQDLHERRETLRCRCCPCRINRLLCCLGVSALASWEEHCFQWDLKKKYLSHDMTKPTKCAPSDQSSLCAWWVAKDLSFLHVDSEDADQTGWMPRLIRVFAGRTLILLVLSCHGSFYNVLKKLWTFGSAIMKTQWNTNFETV